MSNLGSSQLVFLLSEVNKNLTYTFILFLKTLVQIPKKKERERERDYITIKKKLSCATHKFATSFLKTKQTIRNSFFFHLNK